MRRSSLLVLLLVCAVGASAATVESILAASSRTLEGVRDFTCTMTFSVRSTSVRVPESRAKIAYKVPDKFRAEPQDGDFAVLPSTWKFALGNTLQELREHTTMRLLREERLGERNQYVIRADEKDSPGSYYLLWVDTERSTLSAIRTYEPEMEPITMTMGYRREGRAWLPTVANMQAKVPGADGQIEEMRANLKLEGYRVNVGLTDAYFAEPQK